MLLIRDEKKIGRGRWTESENQIFLTDDGTGLTLAFVRLYGNEYTTVPHDDVKSGCWLTKAMKTTGPSLLDHRLFQAVHAPWATGNKKTAPKAAVTDNEPESVRTDSEPKSEGRPASVPANRSGSGSLQASREDVVASLASFD